MIHIKLFRGQLVFTVGVYFYFVFILLLHMLIWKKHSKHIVAGTKGHCFRPYPSLHIFIIINRARVFQPCRVFV